MPRASSPQSPELPAPGARQPSAELLARAAASDAPILIRGEPGTGRSTLARRLHGLSQRARDPYVELDPATIPASLFESELFGFRKGAFTGATASSPGRLERAEGGTLVLDRIEALPLAVQPKLLRLLAERRYSPLGGRERDADVRFIAIGADDLATRLAEGVLREDLYYRLEVISIRLAPLRERRQELEALTAALLEDLGTRLKRDAPVLAGESWEWMRAYSWPGNLRQLANLLERALALHETGPLILPPPREGREPLPRPLAELEADGIRRALAYTRGHQEKAARLLGISRKSLWEKRKRHGIA